MNHCYFIWLMLSGHRFEDKGIPRRHRVRAKSSLSSIIHPSEKNMEPSSGGQGPGGRQLPIIKKAIDHQAHEVGECCISLFLGHFMPHGIVSRYLTSKRYYAMAYKYRVYQLEIGVYALRRNRIVATNARLNPGPTIRSSREIASIGN